MAPKDYVSRGRSAGTRRKKSSGRSKGRSGTSQLMVVLAVAVLVTFAGGLWFLAHHEKPAAPVVSDQKTPGNSLPPRPEERWKYIKELENQQITPPLPAPPPATENQKQPQLTEEQRQLLEQMQTDMRQPPVLLNEVPWNGQTPAQRQQTLQQQQNAQQNKPRLPASTSQTPARETVTTPANENGARWLVQCGSFRNNDQAEAIRAQLAFEGFESRINRSGGWYRVVIGPWNNRTSADNTLVHLRSSGHTNCIPLSGGG